MSPAIRFDAVLPPTRVQGWSSPVSLEIPEGAFCTLVAEPAIAGPFLRLCAGLIAPLTGRVEVLGVQAASLDRRNAQIFRRQLGVGLQPGGLVSNLTVRMNLVVPLLYSGAADPIVAGQRAHETLRGTELLPYADMRPADVPPDVREAAVIARAIARDPALLLLEDPISTLRRHRAVSLLELCRREAHTVVITTPQQEVLLEEFADIAGVWDDSGLKWMAHEVGTH